MNVPTGYTALDLVGFTDKGQYNSATAYVQNDLVHYGGNIWRCLIDDTTGITPSESANWTIFISEPTNMTEAIIAPLETSPASAAHAAGDQLIYNDVLYKVTAAIAIGDSLTVGTNIATARKIVYQISATESMIAHIEYSTTASQAYAVGDYLLYDWTLYKVTTAITQGGTITISGGSANVSATTIGAEISSLNSHIANLDTNKASKTYVDNAVGEIKTVTATGDGVKTRSALYVELMDAMAQIIAQAPSNHIFQILSGPDGISQKYYRYAGGQVLSACSFSASNPHPSTTTITWISEAIYTTASGGTSRIMYGTITSGSVAVTDISSNVIASGTKYAITYCETIEN